MLVGGILFEIITGVLNIQYDYIFGFSFYTAHYYGAWVFIAGFVDPHRDQDPADVDGPAVDVDARRVAHQPGRHRPEPYEPTDWSPRTRQPRRSAAAVRLHWSAAARCSSR